MPLFFLGTREWRNRQTRTVQVRVPVMEWGFNSPLAHNETTDPSGSAVLFSLVVAAVSPLLFSRIACGPTGVLGAGGLGRCVCRWAAARPSDGVACGATGVSGAGGPGRPRG